MVVRQRSGGYHMFPPYLGDVSIRALLFLVSAVFRLTMITG